MTDAAPTRGCITLDPTVPLPAWTRVRFELRPATCVAQVFEWQDETLALRLGSEGDGG
jgi:hypothetical protein